MSNELIQLDARNPPMRILMVLLSGLALVAAWFVVHWYLGNTMAEYMYPQSNALQTVKTAVSYAPSDPLPHWRLASILQTQLPPDQLGGAINEYEKAVSLSPNDYRFWMALGGALEQYGENERAEKALRRSVELAPSYSYPAWYLGNLLLRKGDYPEAFKVLRRASDTNSDFRPQLFNLAWEVYSPDIESIKTAIGGGADTRAQFAQYLLGRNKVEDGLKVWQSLNQTEKLANHEAGKSILVSLTSSQRFHEAIPIANDLSPSLGAEVGKLLDGSFEGNLKRDAEAVFGWQMKTAPQTQIGIDPSIGHTGNQSLRLSFQVRTQLDVINVSQLIAVLPSTTYKLECYFKTQNLQSAATPLLQVLDVDGNSVLAASDSAATGNNDWQRIALSFKTGEKSQAVIVRIGRASCGDNSVCPIFGTIWYDDFSLSRD